jgi:signal transduction histidine kinase
MQNTDQILLFAEVLIYVILALQVLFHRRTDEVEEFLVAFLVLAIIPTLLWLLQLSMRTYYLPPVGIIEPWTRLVPVLAFGVLTAAFVRQTRRIVAWWLLASLVLFAAVVTLQFGWLGQLPVTVEAVETVVWALAMLSATLVVLLTYRRQTSPLHRNRLRYWSVAAALLVVAEGLLLLAPSFSTQIAGRVMIWMTAGLVTYVILQTHPPDLQTLVRQSLRFLILTGLLGLVFFGVLVSVRMASWPNLSERDILLLAGVIAAVMAILIPGLASLLGRALDRLLFGSIYNEQEVVRHYSQSVSNILDLDQLATVAFDVISDVFNLERGALLLTQHTGAGYSTILPVRGRGNAPTQLIEVETFGALMNHFRQSGAPLTQYDVDVLPAYRRIPHAERQWLSQLQMELYVPIRSQGEVIGLLALGPKRSGEAYRVNDLNLLSTLANQTVVALANAQLVQDLRRLNLDVSRLNTELEAMNRTKTDFISIASHELRTPLSQVSGYSQMLAEEVGPKSPLYGYVEGMRKGTNRLTEIVDVMLDVSRLDAGGLVLNRTPVTVSRIIERAAGEWKSALTERGHNLAADGLESLPMLEGDIERLQQVFSQLISNAIKSTPDGGLIEIIGHTYTESSGQFVEVIVKDNGIGIDPADQHKIFDKFYRTGDLMKHSTGKTKFKGAGTGLGLSLVKGIVDAHGGRIWVESLGHDEQTCPGSSFHVLLPLRGPAYNPAMAETMIQQQVPAKKLKKSDAA